MDIDATTVGAVLLAFTPLAVLILRLFVVPDGASLDDLVAPPMDLEWPHGVQQDEPVPWQVDQLTPSDRQVLTHRQPGARPDDDSGARVRVRSSAAAQHEA